MCCSPKTIKGWTPHWVRTVGRSQDKSRAESIVLLLQQRVYWRFRLTCTNTQIWLCHHTVNKSVGGYLCPCFSLSVMLSSQPNPHSLSLLSLSNSQLLDFKFGYLLGDQFCFSWMHTNRCCILDPYPLHCFLFCTWTDTVKFNQCFKIKIWCQSQIKPQAGAAD